MLFRSAASAGDVAGERWPMTRVMREFCQPEIRFESVAEGLIKLTTLRPMTNELTHVRVTSTRRFSAISRNSPMSGSPRTVRSHAG